MILNHTNTLKIALDFDSVLADTMTLWVEKYNSKYNTNHTKSKVTKWAFWPDFQIDKKEADSIFMKTWEDWENLAPTEKGLSETTRQLRDISQVDIVTSVIETHSHHVKKWLKKHDIKYDGFENTKNNKHEYDYDIFIDDDPDLPSKIPPHKRGFVYHQEWNKHVTGINVERIDTLKNALNKLAQKNV